MFAERRSWKFHLYIILFSLTMKRIDQISLFLKEI